MAIALGTRGACRSGETAAPQNCEMVNLCCFTASDSTTRWSPPVTEMKREEARVPLSPAVSPSTAKRRKGPAWPPDRGVRTRRSEPRGRGARRDAAGTRDWRRATPLTRSVRADGSGRRGPGRGGRVATAPRRPRPRPKCPVLRNAASVPRVWRAFLWRGRRLGKAAASPTVSARTGRGAALRGPRTRPARSPRPLPAARARRSASALLLSQSGP